MGAPVPPEASSITPARSVTNREDMVEEDPTPGPSKVKKAAKRVTSPQAANILKVAEVCKPKVARASEKPKPKNRPGQ